VTRQIRGGVDRAWAAKCQLYFLVSDKKSVYRMDFSGASIEKVICHRSDAVFPLCDDFEQQPDGDRATGIMAGKE